MVTDSRREWQLVWMGIAWRNISLISSELAGMALMPETERLIGEWISLSSSPLNLKHPELKYNRLHVGKVFDGVLSPAQPLIRI